MEEIKLLVYDLRPVMLDDFGLVPTLRWYIKSHLQGAGPEIVTDFDEAGLRLPGDVETALYRVTQEALANAVRHSDATKIHVRLVTKPGFVSLAVIDNGKGFDADEILHGDGHRGRAALDQGAWRARRRHREHRVGGRPGDQVVRRGAVGSEELARRSHERRQEPRQIKVLLVDDHAILREGVHALLAREPDISVVGEAGDGEEASSWCPG